MKFLKLMLCPYRIEARSRREIEVVKDLIGAANTAIVELGDKECKTEIDGSTIYT